MNAHPRSNLIGPEIVVPLAEIVGLDPCNSRSAEPDDIEAMAASLRETKQLQALLVRRIGSSRFLVLAGGRRWRAFHVLAAAAGSTQIDVRVRVFNGDDDAAREASLAENFERQGLHPLDEADRFAELAARLGLDRVARDFGAPKRYVRERLALASLSTKVRDAWRDGRIGYEAAKAFTVARDHAEQDALIDAPDFARLAAYPLEIRRRLAARAVPISAPAAIFVGVDAYVAAGGMVLEDLFGEEPRFADRALLERLEREKLASATKALRAEEGWGFVVADEDACLLPRKRDMLFDERDALERIERQQNETLTPEAYEALIVERDRIERVAALRAVPTAERHRYGVAVAVDGEGRLEIKRAVIPRASPLADDRRVPPVHPDLGEPGPDSDAETPSPARAIGAGDDSEPPAKSAYSRRVPLDAPLAPAARRIAEAAATRAVAQAVATNVTLAMGVALAAFARAAGAYRGPVRVARCQGPWNVKSPLALQVGKSDFEGALKALDDAGGRDVDIAFAECVAASIDLRGADAGDADALFALVEACFETDVRQAIPDAFDYPTFFREASRATALLALRECGGEALEMAHAWRADESLRDEAALIARAKRWLPEFLNLKGART